MASQCLRPRISLSPSFLLIENDPEVKFAIEILRRKGISPEQVNEALLRPVFTSKQNIRRAERSNIDEQIKTIVGTLLAKYKLGYEGKNLDHARLGRNNFAIIKSEIDKAVNHHVGMKENSRQDFTQEQYDKINSNLVEITAEAERKLFNGKN